jgi:predicted TIM-barrel fold metal-dependent hydrolase
MIVDVNLHWSPDNFYTDNAFLKECLRAIPRAYGEHVEIVDIPGTGKKQVNMSRPKGYPNLNFEVETSDPEDRLRAMDEGKIDKGILRWCIWPEWATLEICRKVNDAMAKSVKQHPDRLSGLAIVPPWGDEDCLAELDRCINELGCVGVEIAAHYGTLYLDSEEFRPFFKKINSLKIPIIVHHTALPVDYGHIYEYVNLRRPFARCIDQMTSVGRIMFSEMLDEFPNLKFIHSMMAGGLFAYTTLITPKKSRVPGDMERFDPAASEKVMSYLKSNIYCDLTHAPTWSLSQIKCAVEELGADHVLFGTSYPLRREWLVYGVDHVRGVDISEKEKALVLGENAMKLFNLKG